MINMFSSILKLLPLEHGSSFLSAPLFLTFIGRLIVNLFNMLMNFITTCAWMIIKFVLGIMEALEYMINEFLGIDSTVNDMYEYATSVGSGATSFVTILSKTYRAVFAVSIVLLIIFTIYAIIKQEWQNATSLNAKGNAKGPIILGMFKKMLYIVLLPLTMIFIITGVNSILTSFSRAMKGGLDVTVAAQVLSTATYDSNKYRYYAQQNKRIPIVIKAYDPALYDPDENELLIEKINSSEVQYALRTTASNISSNNLLSFKDSLQYKNNKLSNSTEYGDYYEKFICTAEQYQVMADFIDFAQKTNMPFQIKSIDDPNIEWMHVDSAVFNKEDAALTINYRDASDLDDDGSTKDSYTIEYSSGFEVTSPISDALDSIMALLGVGEYSDNLYKTMERDDDYVNLVQWQNEKVLIKLTGTGEIDKNTHLPITFVLDDPTTWSRTDQLFMNIITFHQIIHLESIQLMILSKV